MHSRPPHVNDQPAFYVAPELLVLLDEKVKQEAWDDAVPLLERHGPSLLQQGRVEVLEPWLLTLPADVLGLHPELIMLHGQWLEWQGRWLEALAAYYQALQLCRQQADKRLLARALYCMAMATYRYGEQEVSIEALQEEARAFLHDSDGQVEASTLSWVSAIHAGQGKKLALAYPGVEQGYHLARQADDVELVGQAAIRRGLVQGVAAGEFGPSIALLGEMADFCTRHQGHALASHLKLNQALVCVFAGATAQADGLLDELEKGAPCSAYVTRAMVLTRALLALQEGDIQKGRQFLRQLDAAPVAQQHEPWYLAVDVGLSLLEGDRVRADRLHEKLESVVRDTDQRGFFVPYCALVSSRYWQVVGDLEAARETAEWALEVAWKGRMPGWEMQAHCRLAELGCNPRYHLEQALKLTRQHDYAALWQSDPRGTRAQLLQEARSLGLNVQLTAEPAVALPLGPVPSAPPAPVIHLRTFGELQLEVDGKSVPASSMRQRAILQLLKLLLSGTELSLKKDELAQSLWPDLEEKSAQQNLARNVGKLAQLLLELGTPPGAVRSTEGAYQLMGGPHLWVDWMEFGRLMQEANRHREQGRLTEARSTYRAAHELYRGDFLGTDQSSPSIVDRRAALRRDEVTCLRWLGDLHQVCGDYRAAVEWFGKALRMEPTQEMWLSRLLTACAASRDAKTGQQAYRRFILQLRNASQRDVIPGIRRHYEAFLKAISQPICIGGG